MAAKRSSMQRALRTRDAGLKSIKTMTRLLVAGAVLAAGLFSTLAAAAAPGRTKAGPARQRAASASSANSLSDPGLGSGAGADANLSPPPALPSQDYQYTSPPVVSGAS